MRGAVPDIRMALSKNETNAGIVEPQSADLEDPLRNCGILAVVDQREMDRFERAGRARRADRELELAQHAFQNLEIRAIGDDADLQRGRQHGPGVYPVVAAG